MKVLAIGGTAAVSDSVMAAAVSATASADALTVTLGSLVATPGEDDELGTADDGEAELRDADDNPILAATARVRLYFSDDVTQDDTANVRNKLEDILFDDGIPADIQNDGTDTEVCDPDSVSVTLAQSLTAGDTISIVASRVTVGADSDLRPVQPTSATVPAAPVDRQRPSLRIVAIIGHEEVYAIATDNVGLATSGLGTAITNPAADASNDEGTELTTLDFAKLFEVTADKDDTTITSTAVAFAADNKSAVVTFNLTEGQAVEAVDRFRANRGAFKDSSGNESQVTTGVPVRAVSKLQVSSALMSNLKHTSQASAPILSSYAG